MKRLLFLLIALVTLFPADAEKFRIMSLTTPSITIGGKTLRKGDVFSDTSTIKWVDNKQSMEVKAISTGNIYRFSRKVFASKGATTSIADYFLKTKKASSRGDDRAPSFTRSDVASNFPEKRIALVVGNSNYDNLSYLRNASKDASDIGETLLSLGFDVMEAYETSFSDMKTAINNFSAKAAGYDVALFYYAGHGLQEDGVNYLIPVENALEYKHASLRASINCDDIVDLLNRAGTPSKIFFLDACRNTKRAWSRDVNQGLARMEASVGSMIIFATQSGNTATDGDGDNSPFALALINNIRKPDVSCSIAMDNLVRDTYNMTQRTQYPQKTGTLIEDFYFNTPVKKNTAPKGYSSNPTPPTFETLQTKDLAEQAYNTANECYNEKNYAEAATYYQLAIDAGHPKAAGDLGPLYYNGLGVKQDYAIAAELFAQAAANGYMYAQHNLGLCYQYGNGVTQSYTYAEIWYNLAANQGFSESQYKLAYLYSNGLGVEKNPTEAAKWYAKAADQGHTTSQYQLAYMYEKGIGVQENINTAVKLYQKAAEAGSDKAQNNLGVCYVNGTGVVKDYAKAMQWYRRAAEQGNKYSCYNLGLLYQYGDGTPVNLDEARRWYKAAADLGHDKAAEKLKTLDSSSGSKTSGKYSANSSGKSSGKSSAGTSSASKTLTVVGWVKDSGREPLIGVTVMVDGSNPVIVTATDLDGKFQLANVPVGSTLIFSYIGYKPKSVKLSSADDIPMTVILTAE